MRKAINLLQAAASGEGTITEDRIYDVVSKARPKDISNMVTKALTGDFMGARDLLRETMVLQGIYSL